MFSDASWTNLVSTFIDDPNSEFTWWYLSSRLYVFQPVLLFLKEILEIDDAFNSNPIGSKMALDVIKQFGYTNDIISLAERLEEVFVPHESTSI